MLEEEEKVHRERINAKLPEVVSETYWNFISTINNKPQLTMTTTLKSESAALVCPTGPHTADRAVGDRGAGISS